MISLKKAYRDFVAKLHEEGKSKSTIVAYSKDIEQLVDHLYKDGLEMVHEVNTDHLTDFMNKMAEIGLTNKTISRKTNATKTFFRYLIETEVVQVNVADGLKHPRVESAPPRILSRLEYRALRDTARDDLRTFTIIEVLLQTGVSISEIAAIEIDHIEIEEVKGTLHIPEANSRDQRKIPLNKAVVEAINNYLEEARPSLDHAKHLFITKSGKPMLVRNIRSTVDRYFKLAGIKDAKVNDLRHTFIAHHLSQGTSLQTISRIVGHKRISTTEKYLEYIERENNTEKMELGVL